MTELALELSDLIAKAGMPPDQVLVMRHRPTEPELRKVLPWLAAENPTLFNAYQQTQSETAERALARASYLASFIGQESGKATFVGFYKLGKSKPIGYEDYWQVPAYKQMQAWGHKGFSGKRPQILWFDLEPLFAYAEWKGRLIVNWPPPERAWWRWASRNKFIVDAILSESRFSRGMPQWDQINLTWDELQIIPSTWRSRLREWRGIYFIYETAEHKGYVGSASGKDNLLGRWQNYASRSDGGNKLLRACAPQNLRFSILQRVSPDLEAKDVVALESSWKERLHTREFGLNLN